MPLLNVLRDEVPPMPTLSGLPQNIPLDTRPIGSLGMVAIKIYAFGGLAFMAATVLTALSYWFWVVVINREFADSPPWLDLHPERMRAREIARIARRKARKEERKMEEERRRNEKFTPPPVRLTRRTPASEGRRARATTLPVVGFPEETPRAKPTQPPPHNPLPPTTRPRKSSLCPPATRAVAANKKDRRVSWASSTLTLDVNNIPSTQPIEPPKSPTFGPNAYAHQTERREAKHRAQMEWDAIPLPSFDDALKRIQPVRVATPRSSVALESRARFGREMIDVMTAEDAGGWARPAEPLNRMELMAKYAPQLPRSRLDG